MDQRVSRVSQLRPVRSKVREVLYELRVRPMGKIRVSVDKQLYSNPLSVFFVLFFTVWLKMLTVLLVSINRKLPNVCLSCYK